MQAITQRAYGTVGVLKLETIDTPVIGENDVLIRVRAAAINHADWVMITGRPSLGRLAFGIRKPKVIVRGRDVAGTVHAVGSDVRRFKPGDEVYAEVDTGSFAEYARVSADLVAMKPANLTFEQAATVPTSGNTALQGLRDRGRLRPGQKVLINGASGGVGTFAVQIAKALGAEVTAVCSTRNVELVQGLGADRVIDYTQNDFSAGAQRYDLIFDLVGNHPLAAIRRSLTRNGTLVLSNGSGSPVLGPLGRIARAVILSPFISQNLHPFAASRSSDNLDLLRELIEAGTITPAIDRTYQLSDTAEAIRYFAEDHARAKIAIIVRSD